MVVRYPSGSFGRVAGLLVKPIYILINVKDLDLKISYF